MLHHHNTNQKKVWVAILILNSLFQSKEYYQGFFKRSFLNDKGSTRQDDIIVLNVYITNKRDSKYTNQKLIELQEIIDKFTIILRGFLLLLLFLCG